MNSGTTSRRRSPLISLLDVNILVALFDPDHAHHEAAHDWFADHRTEGWATCPITENGFIRVLSSPSRGDAMRRPLELIERLRTLCASGGHVFWVGSLSIRDAKLFNLAVVRGHRQITDVYLLGLARKMGGCLATFDRAIPLGAVVGATRAHLSVISPA